MDGQAVWLWKKNGNGGYLEIKGFAYKYGKTNLQWEKDRIGGWIRIDFFRLQYYTVGGKAL